MIKRFIFLPLIFSIFLFLWGVSPPRELRGANGIVGAEICKGCHEDKYQTYLLSTHSKKAIRGTPANKEECESCHGPGAAHVEKSGEGGVGIFIFGKRIEDARAKTAKCLACHGEARDLSFWDLAKHRIAGISCDNCHTVHSGTRKNLKATQPDLCYVCHRNVRSQQNKQSHHPVREGKLKCTDCHEHHGGFGPGQIKADSINELCYRCHSEKRGPYMWPHPAVEENCGYCHTPHGSNHNKLLNSRMPQVCRNCHDFTRHPSTLYTRFETFQGTATSGKNRMFARSCLNCHGNIHGSNAPSLRGSTLVR